MNYILTNSYEAMSKKAASLICAQILMKPACVLGLATGSTPIGAYKQLAALFKAGELSFKGVSTVNLDEYCGLQETHPQSYRTYMNTNL
ncbi:MAG TPA: glucosamine-6-phosphate deaminase, partial [Clostridia bacterium]|nr:glucosamine-6-phosphate deaminase [Clostridia bacterium]